jgi:hypothetical protein
MDAKLGNFRFMPLGTMIGVGSSILDFRRRYEEGEDIETAAAKSIVKGAVSVMVPWLGWGGAAYHVARGAARFFDNTTASLGETRDSYQQGFGWSYTDTPQAATMRQAAKQIIQQSQLNARYVIGNEAKYMRRG